MSSGRGEGVYAHVKYVPRMERVSPPGGGGVERSKGPRSVRVRWPAEGSGRPFGGMEVKRRALLVDILVVDGVWRVGWMLVWGRWMDGGEQGLASYLSGCGSRAFIDRDPWPARGILSPFSLVSFSPLSTSRGDAYEFVSLRRGQVLGHCRSLVLEVLKSDSLKTSRGKRCKLFPFRRKRYKPCMNGTDGLRARCLGDF